MQFANPWGLLGLIAVPVIIAIHLFVQRFPPLEVAGLHLWGGEVKVPETGRRRDRLPITTTLILELLAALLLTIGLSQPMLTAGSSAAHLYFVLDHSASMSGTAPNGETFRDRAIAKVAERVQSAGRDTKVTLIRTGSQPVLLGFSAMPWDEAEQLLQTWEPIAAAHDFQTAWDEAVHATGEQGRFTFITDRLPTEESNRPAGMEVVAVGESVGNVAITAARWIAGQSVEDGSLFFRVRNHSPANAQVSISGTTPSGELFTQSVSMPTEQELPFEVPVRSGLGEIVLQVESEEDRLALDSRVTLIEPQHRVVDVAVMLPEENAEAELVARMLRSLDDVQVTTPDKCVLVFGTTAELPVTGPQAWVFRFGPMNRGQAFRDQAQDLLGPFVIDKHHELTNGLVLGGIIWGGVQAVPGGITPIITSGRVPLLVERTGTPNREFIMNIDLARSNLGESPDWPILIANLIETRRAALPGLRRWNYRVNERFGFLLPEDAERDWDEVELAGKDGRSRALVADRLGFVEVPEIEAAGTFIVRDSNGELGRFAVNFFDETESDLRELATGRLAADDSATVERLAVDTAYGWLIAFAILLILACLLADWYVLRKRGQPQA